MWMPTLDTCAFANPALKETFAKNGKVSKKSTQLYSFSVFQISALRIHVPTEENVRNAADLSNVSAPPASEESFVKRRKRNSVELGTISPKHFKSILYFFRMCLNGGTCHNDGSSARCECAYGFTGQRCEQTLNLGLFYDKET